MILIPQGTEEIRGQIYYPVLKEDVSIHLTAANSHLYVKRRGDVRLSRNKRIQVNNVVARYLVKCDGEHSNLQIADSLSDGLDPLYGEIWANEIERQLQKFDLLVMHNEPLSEPRKIRVTGNFRSFKPVHISYELTEHCNFRCEHCYVSASPEKSGSLSLKEVISLIDKLAAEGVRVFEITGGECTTYPHFLEVLDHATNTFDLVAIITNGYYIGKSKKLQDAIGRYNNIMVQISIDGMREYHDNFRKMPGSFDACIDAVKALKKYGIVMRVSTSVTEENVCQLRDLYRLIKELGVEAWAVAPITSFGRGDNLTNTERQHKVIHAINNELAEFSHDRIFESQTKVRKPRNCGAGSRTFALDYKGEVRSCLFLAESKKFGNVHKSSFDSLFGQEANHQFYNAPSPGGKDCDGCKYLPVCTGCFAKAFKISETEYPECPWRKKWFPGLKLDIRSTSGSSSGCTSTGCCGETYSGSISDNKHNDLLQIRNLTH